MSRQPDTILPDSMVFVMSAWMVVCKNFEIEAMMVKEVHGARENLCNLWFATAASYNGGTIMPCVRASLSMHAVNEA